MDSFFLALYLLVASVAAPIFAWLWFRLRKSSKLLAETLSNERFERSRLLSELYAEIAQLEPLKKYKDIQDVDAHIESISRQASETLAAAEEKSRVLVSEASQQADSAINQARTEASSLIDRARSEAKIVAGDALAAKEKAAEYSRLVQSLKNTIDGYGEQYMVPVFSLLDELADDFGHTDAGEKLKAARAETRRLVKIGQAASCDYAEPNRKTTAIRFVIDAFNGKVDSILARSKADNFGTLRQQILDAFALVNANGAAFRNAKILDTYLENRLEELRWGCITHELREKEREEQRAIREQIRDEERAQREFEKSMRDAAKEEELLRRAMEKARQQIDSANSDQKQQYEAQLAELEERLRIAEERNQRAISMAQQTRCGHVYVVSNIGSFGDDVLKIGMTRRLEPRDRIQELGDASVPFPFDIHAMIYCEDAPALERTLHKILLRQQVNKVNPRKEFFKTGIQLVRAEFEKLGISAHWTMAADAREYRESKVIEQKMLESASVAIAWEQSAAQEVDRVAQSVGEEGLNSL